MKNLIKSKTIDCFFCNTIVDKKEAFTAEVDTSEGKLNVKMCKECANDFDDLLKNIEEVKNEGL